MAHDAQRFLRLAFLGLPFFIAYACIQRFLQAQNVVAPCVMVEIIGARAVLARSACSCARLTAQTRASPHRTAALVHAALSVLLTFGFGSWGGWGIEGAAASLSVGRAITLPLLLVVLRCRCWQWNRKG